ncbi:1-acyl-sn-glycerol-3-phosphate acyltransferase 2-like [Argentina anserina]|uniref:1-acyl-sn-glycerol-3-phosphate acyltransferase 2-like n=1 Tax=Argentina anserina TaxID=57926 RepID=UPI0021765780|nr:1-acyl-sn-glycerol-3-phosphate acyltransferase 2-like [Potentilla anserina]
MATALGIVFSAVVVLYPLIGHFIPAVLLCASGLFTNLVQAICFVCIPPISENAYTRINGVVKEMDWRILIGLIDFWTGVKIQESLVHEVNLLNGEEHQIFFSNARDDEDHLLKLVLDQWSGCLGSLLAVIKTLSNYIASDLKDFPQSFWLSVVLERTGFTQGDLLAAQSRPVPGKVLISETKDLVYAVKCACSAVPAIYLITLANPKASPALTLESAIKAPSLVHVYIRRHATKNWLETDDADEEWCTQILAAKYALLNEHMVEISFGNKGLQAIGRPLKCFLVGISLIVLWALNFNFVCGNSLVVLSAALFTGRLLALFGCGVLSLLKCFLEAAIANITYSDHIAPIFEPILECLLDCAVDFITTFPLEKYLW